MEIDRHEACIHMTTGPTVVTNVFARFFCRGSNKSKGGLRQTISPDSKNALSRRPWGGSLLWLRHYPRVVCCLRRDPKNRRTAGGMKGCYSVTSKVRVLANSRPCISDAMCSILPRLRWPPRYRLGMDQVDPIQPLAVSQAPVSAGQRRSDLRYLQLGAKNAVRSFDVSPKEFRRS